MRGIKQNPVIEEQFRKDYEGFTEIQLVEKYGVGKGTIYRWKKLYGIKGRDKIKFLVPKPTVHKMLDDREWLNDLYINQRKSSGDIAKIVGCARGAVHWALTKHGILTRDVKSARSNRYPNGVNYPRGDNYSNGKKDTLLNFV